MNELLPKTNTDVLPVWVTMDGVAAMLSVSRTTVWRLTKAGVLPPPVKIGGSTRWNRDLVLAAVERGRGAA